MEEQNQTHPGRLMIGLLVLACAIALVVAIYLFRQSTPADLAVQTSKTQEDLSPTAIPYLTQGTFSIQPASQSATFNQNNSVVIHILANSEGKQVGGYDVIINYDTDAFEYVSSKSLISGFQIFPEDTIPTHLSITAVKSPNSSDRYPVFKDTPVVELVFRPKKSGRAVFALTAQYGVETSKLVTRDLKKLAPSVNAVTIEVQ